MWLTLNDTGLRSTHAAEICRCWRRAQRTQNSWQGREMTTDNSLGTSHSSTRGACSTAFFRQSPRRPQQATGTRTLSLTGLAMSPPGERVTLTLEDGGPSIEAGGLTPLEARLDQNSARRGASWTQTSCIFSSSPDCLLLCLWVSASSSSSCPSAYGLS